LAGFAYFLAGFSLKMKKQVKMYELRIRAITTERRYFTSSLTSTKAVANLAVFPRTVNPHVIMERLPVEDIR